MRNENCVCSFVLFCFVLFFLAASELMVRLRVSKTGLRLRKFLY